jgi:hypothetical protein
MTRARASLRLVLGISILSVGACATQKKPLTGFDKVPPGAIVLGADPGGSVVMWPMFDLPQMLQIFRPRIDGKDIVYLTSEEGFYDYYTWTLQGWTGGWASWIQGVEPGAHTVELVDSGGQSWGKSAPLAIAAGGTPSNPSGQEAAVLFAHFDGNVASWTVDPSSQDADTTTDEITMTNLAGEAAVVERCLISSSNPSSCTLVGSVAPGADLLTVEKVADVAATDDHQALVIHLASESYRRDLRAGTGGFNFGSTCQVERIIVHSPRQTGYSPTAGPSIAMSSCYGYQNGPM